MSEEQKLKDNGLAVSNRFITEHDADGKAVFSSRFPEALPWQDLGPGLAHFSLAYATAQIPVAINKDKDLMDYDNFLENKPGIVIPNGTVLRIVDCPPASLSPMHRTVSLDYGVVLEGEIALELDSGETRIMRRGDISIQRGTNHAWRNLSKDKWARMLYMLQECEPISLKNGEKLGEDYGEGMPGVKASGH